MTMMATQPTIPRNREDARKNLQGLRVCHFTIRHTELKSRAFHRELMPLAAEGAKVRYLAPLALGGRREGVEFVLLQRDRSRLRRIFSSLSLLRMLVRERADLYHMQDPELLPVAFALKLLFRKRVVYDAYEDFPSILANKRAIPRPFQKIAAGLIKGIEKLAARCFDGLITADPLTLRRLAHEGNSRKLVFYNFPNLDFFSETQKDAKRFDVVYRGGLSERAGTYLLLEAARLLAAEQRPVRLLLIGYFDDAAEKALRRRILESGLGSSTVIRGRVPHEHMAQALAEARVGVCPLQPVPKFLRNIPVKVFEYWACGLPVVASDLPPIRPFLRHGDAGLLYSAESAWELARAISWLLDHPSSAAAMGERGRELVEQRFNNRAEIRKLRRFCERVTAHDKIEFQEAAFQEAPFRCSSLW